MRRFRPETFVVTARFLSSIIETKKTDDKAIVSAVQKRRWRRAFSSLERICNNAGFVTSAFSITRIREILSKRDCTYGRLRQPFRELYGRLVDEMRASVLLSVPMDKTNFFSGKHLLGQTVTDNFPSAVVDIEEAGKCLALGRTTATVFHLMRVMEHALRVLAATLNDTRLDPRQNPTWQRILERSNEELSKPRAQRSSEWAAHDEFFSSVTTHLMGVKDAWRNPTMHIGTTYSEEQALDIWNHVAAFMRTLATKLHE